MRLSLRNQILLPMAGLVLVTLLSVSALNVYLAVQRTRSQIESQLRDVTRTIAEANYPLSDNVLRQMRDLSGAELFVETDSGERLAGSSGTSRGDPTLAAWSSQELPPGKRIGSWSELKLGEVVPVAGKHYFHSALSLQRNSFRTQSLELHLLYPEHRYREALRDAVLPPIVVGSGALVLMTILAHWFASRLTQPIARLQQQVERISHGEFYPMPLPARNDELRDLATAVNRMSHLLAEYEDEIRRSEQLRTLGVLRGGIAHQMRNAVTGCRMALELHRRELEQPSGSLALKELPDRESLDVAMRQLVMIEKQLQKFLSEQQAPLVTAEVDLADVVSSVVPLIVPAAQHLGVGLDWEPPARAFPVKVDVAGMEQSIGNLLLNALDAAVSGSETKQVRVEILQLGPERVALCVHDSGPGPSEIVRHKLFEPLVTDKRGGTGLGLSVAREVAEQQGGEVTWLREGGWTCFRIELPLAVKEPPRVEASGR